LLSKDEARRIAAARQQIFWKRAPFVFVKLGMAEIRLVEDRSGNWTR